MHDRLGAQSIHERSRSMSREGKRVLVAEDDDAARDMLGALLVQAGYNVHATNDGREALEELHLPRQRV